jgi:hypothetical protein
MPAPDRSTPDSPFGQHDYEFAFGRLETFREVDIHALSAPPLRVGETFTFGLTNGFYDVIVSEVTRPDGGGWNARCKVIDLQWI